MYFMNVFRKNGKSGGYFERANALKVAASNPLTDENSSFELYSQAYETYRKICENIFFSQQTRGEASYNMYLLAKENKVTLSPATNNGITLQTSEERRKTLLICSANFGYSNAMWELEVPQQPSVLSISQQSSIDSACYSRSYSNT
jgi:hypothetical protein